MQKRLHRKLDLKMLLSSVEPHPLPRPDLEQYTISVDAAATMLYLAACVNRDVEGKSVLDLGCGTGRLALGAAFLGATQVVGVDIDRKAVAVACSNSIRTGLKEKVQWVISSLNGVRGEFDTVLQNPPFGVQKRSADRWFIERALELGHVIYSFHKGARHDRSFVERLKRDKNGFIAVSPSPFLERFINVRGGQIRSVYAMVMMVPHMFGFHTRRRHEFVADLYVLEGRRR